MQGKNLKSKEKSREDGTKDKTSKGTKEVDLLYADDKWHQVHCSSSILTQENGKCSFLIKSN